MKKKVLSLVLALMMVLSLMPTAFAAETVDSGKCGTSVTWTLDDEGTLTISGSGAMKDYSEATGPAWRSAEVKKIVVKKGVTTIGKYAFAYMDKVEEVVLPSGLTTIGACAFVDCDGVDYFELPTTVKTIGKKAFAYCDGINGAWIPDSVTSMSTYVFQSCANLEVVYLSKGLKSIPEGTFKGCRKLQIVMMYPVSGGVKADAFSGCSSMSAIYWLGEPDTFIEMSENIASGNSALGHTAAYLMVVATKDPKDATTSVGGNSVTFTTAASHSKAKFLWMKQAPGSEEWTEAKGLTGYKTKKLTVPAEAKYDGYQFACYIYRDAGEYGILEATSQPATMTVLPAPEITVQPVGVKVKGGEMATVTLEATGSSDLTYEWYYAAAGSSTYKKTTSFTGPEYSIEMSESRAGRKVYCKVIDKYGASVTTDKVTLAMDSELLITQQPADVQAASGKTAAVTIKASGLGLKYEWYWAAPGSDDFKLTTSFKTNTYSISMNESRDGRRVYCKVYDKFGNMVQSDIATLTMVPPPQIVVEPTYAYAKKGEEAVVSFEATGTGELTYEWYWAKAGSSTYKKTTSFTGPEYKTVMDDTRAGRKVYCVVTDETGASVKTKTVTLRMALEITEDLADVAVELGEKAAVTVKANGQDLKYEWFYADNGGEFKKTTSFKTATYSVTMTESRSGRQVFCRITDKYGNIVETATATLSAKAVEKTPLAITKQPETVSVKDGEKATVTVEAEGDGLTYAWYWAPDYSKDFQLTTSFKTNTYSITMNSSRAGRQVYCIITDKYGETIRTDTVRLEMNSEKTPLAITAQPHDVTVNEGEKATVEVKATGDGLSYEWHFSDDGGESYHVTTTFTTGVYSVTMNEARAGRRVYCIITDQYGESVTSETAILGMN